MNSNQSAENTNKIDPVVAANGLVETARVAMSKFENENQARVDDAVTAVAWSIYKPTRCKELAELAVLDTGLGNVRDKIIKNSRKTFGTLRDLLRVKTVGIINNDPDRGIVKFAKPVGVVAAVCPSTNPAATPVNKSMMALKGGNAVVIAPSPAGYSTTTKTVHYMREELKHAGHPEDLVQILPAPLSKELTQALMEQSDLVVCTGSQNNVRRAYSSGTVTIGVGAGNVPVIIDSTADLNAAAEKICQSKIFDNSTSCSSENAVVILDDIYEQAIAALESAGGYRTTSDEKDKILKTLWDKGQINRHMIAKDADKFAKIAGLAEAAKSNKFFLVEDDQIGKDHPLSDEKLSLVLTVYRASDFDEAKNIVGHILDVKGIGHSCGIHTNHPDHAKQLAEELKVVRVLVNQAHTFGNGGSFDNGLNFTLSMGCGTWAGNSISENLNYRHFINITHLVTTIAEDKPSEEDLFGAYWRKHGK